MIDYCRQRRLLVPGRRWCKQRPQPGGQHDPDAVDNEREDNDILPDDSNGLARKPHNQGQRLEGVAHHNDIASFSGHVRAGAADRQAHVGTGQTGGIIDAVTHHGNLARALPTLKKFRLLLGQ